MLVLALPGSFPSRPLTDATLALAEAEFLRLCARRTGPAAGSYRLLFRLDAALPAFRVTAAADALEFSGPSPVEILYAVYDFAEKVMGFSFVEPGIERLVGGDGEIMLAAGVVLAAPAPLLRIRGFIQEFPFGDETPMLADWMAKNKLNYLHTWMKYYDQLDAAGRRLFAVRGIEIQSGHHNFDYWIPGRKYHQEHPEFFAEIGGQRIKPGPDKNALLLSEQLCTTNPALRAEIVRNMIAYAEANPELKTLSLIPNDGFGWCECPVCARFYDKSRKGELYSLSEHVYLADTIYHDLLRDVAARLAAVRPDLKLNFCAYINYCRPSEGFRLAPNLSVYFANYWRCINHRIDDPACSTNRHYAEDIRRWAGVHDGGDLIIYEYFMGVNFYLSLPMVHFDEMFDEMAWYSRNRVDGITTQFHLPHWTVYGLNYVLMARAARGENKEESIAALLRAVFGADWERAQAFYAAVKRLLLSAGPCHIPYPHALFRRTRREQYVELHRLSGELAAGAADDDRFRRELPVWTEYLLRFKELYDRYQTGSLQEADLDELLAWIARHQHTRVFVQGKFPVYFRAWREALRSGKPWLHFNIAWEDRYIRQHETTLG